MADASEIRRVLQVLDQAAAVGPRQAVGMLQGITAAVAKSPAAYDLLEDPSDAEAWRSGGGESFCENVEFPNKLAERWIETLTRPDFSNAGFDKEELAELKAAMTGWAASFAAAQLEFGDDEGEELLALLDELTEAAPEADDSDSETDSSDE